MDDALFVETTPVKQGDMETEAMASVPKNPESPCTVAANTPTSGLENTSIDIISQNMRAMVKKIQDLRHLGIEDTVPLPKICVVGDQSAGKSSLIEGMSEIKVPRSSGCCTRCPLEINLSESDAPWTCRIYLTQKYTFVGAAKPRRGERNQRLGPWELMGVPEERPFETLMDKNMYDLKEALKRAQLATLNPGRSPQEFMRDDSETNSFEDLETQVKFSPNVVRLDIAAPSFPNLSFYDLPGVINVAEIDEEKYLVPLVTDLVKEYVRAENCIVLLTMPMTDDATNSSAARIIHWIPGARERTLGVLTKPDRIQGEEGYQQWREILSGQKFSIGHGYYVVKNDPDPAVDHTQARQDEVGFFSETPWTTELGEFNDRFGTRNLQSALSQLLLHQIQKSLPGIVEQISAQAAKVEIDLQSFPDPPNAGNIPFIIAEKLSAYTMSIDRHIDGGNQDYPFLKDWSQVASDFQKYLIESRPGLKLREKNPVWRNPPGGCGDESEVEITYSQPSPKRKPAGNGEPEKKRVKTTNSPAPAAIPKPAPAWAQVNTIEFETEHFVPFEVPANFFSLEDLRAIHQDTYRSGVPGLGNPQAVETLNRQSVAHWKGPMEMFLSVTYDAIQEMLLGEVYRIFADYCQTNLYSKLHEIILKFLKSIKVDHLCHATENLNVEYDRPFTMASATFHRAQKEALDLLQIKRLSVRQRMYANEIEQQNVQNGNGKKVNLSKITEDDMGPDEFKNEIETMAAVRAYYEIASTRFVDATCQSILTKLFFKCRKELKEYIVQELGVVSDNASERCQELMVEDNERDASRKSLKRKKERLNKAQLSLQESTGSELPFPSR